MPKYSKTFHKFYSLECKKCFPSNEKFMKLNLSILLASWYKSYFSYHITVNINQLYLRFNIGIEISQNHTVSFRKLFMLRMTSNKAVLVKKHVAKQHTNTQPYHFSTDL